MGPTDQLSDYDGLLTRPLARDRTIDGREVGRDRYHPTDARPDGSTSAPAPLNAEAVSH